MFAVTCLEGHDMFDDEVPEWVCGLPARIEFEVVAESEWWERVAAELDDQ